MSVELKYTEEIYHIEFKNSEYKLSIVNDWDVGDFEYVVYKYDKSGELVAPTKKQREDVIEYFNNNKD